MQKHIAKKAQLEAQLHRVCGYPCELTFRGETAFTVSFEEIDTEAAETLVAFFTAAGADKLTVETDAELQMTFVYFEA